MMAYKNRWSNFNNEELYDKYKRSQNPPAPAPAPASGQQQQQQPIGEWNRLGNNIGKAWRESLAKRNDGVYNGQIVGGVGSDAENANLMQQIQNVNPNLLTTDWASVSNAPLAISGETLGSAGAGLGAEIGSGIGGGLGAEIGSGIGGSIGSGIGAGVAPGALAESLGSAATLGGAASGEAIGAGTTAATQGAAGAAAGGIGLGTLLGPLAGWGIYEIGKHNDWW